MNFFTSIHCKSEAHCQLCRARNRGHAWRKDMILIFNDLPYISWPCPVGKEWQEDAPIGPPSKFEVQVDKITQNEGVGTSARFIKAMAVQLLDIYRKTGGSACGCSKDSFQTRLTAKLDYYLAQYSPSADALNPSYNPSYGAVHSGCQKGCSGGAVQEK